MTSKNPLINEFYEALLSTFGPQHWWPGHTRDEMIIGAVLTQNTAWRNVEIAINRLKQLGLLSISAVHQTDVETLSDSIRSAGTHNVKARRLKSLVGWITHRFGGDLDKMFAEDPAHLRADLLTVHGVGPETADAIMLYAGNMATFVVDAYTKRFLRRHRLIKDDTSYHTVKTLFEESLPSNAAVFGEYHALIVELGKRHCRPTAVCQDCPLQHWPHDESP
jgi:endonuclease III related protein